MIDNIVKSNNKENIKSEIKSHLLKININFEEEYKIQWGKNAVDPKWMKVSNTPHIIYIICNIWLIFS